MPERLYTYAELAFALGCSPEAARQKAVRKRWRRTISNEDGKARIAVPEDALPVCTPHVGPDIPPTPPPTPSTPESGLVPPDVHPVAELQARVAELIADLRVEREKSVGLVALLEAEKRRGEELRVERDRWSAQAAALAPATRSWWPWRRTA